MSEAPAIGIVMDPLADINPPMDTTLALMLAAQQRGAALYYMEQDDLFLKGGKACGKMQPVTVYDDNKNWFSCAEPLIRPLTELDAIFMRKDPPVDKRFIHSCYMLEQAAREGAFVTNNPAALYSLNEKLFTLQFPQFCPASVVTANQDILHEFHAVHRKIVIKPLDSMGGQGVFLVEPDGLNLDVIWEVQTQKGRYPVFAQEYLPAIAEGDKRVVIFDGRPAEHVLVRTPRQGSIRSNLAAGGSYVVRAINETERHIVETLGPVLRDRGILFAGLDVIGDRLTEINITCPTGLRQLSAGSGTDLPGQLIDLVLRRTNKAVT